MIDTFYTARWQKFLTSVADLWDDFEQASFDAEIKSWEAEWTARRGEDLAVVPNGRGLAVAQEVYDLFAKPVE